MITRCLSKLQGSALRTLLTSEALSKINRTLWSPRLQTLNPLLNHHRGVKVLAIASMLRACFIRNFAVIICYWELRSLSKQQLGSSLSESIRGYWMMNGRGRKNRKNCFLIPLKNTRLANRLTLLIRGRQQAFAMKAQQFYCLREVRGLS